MMAQPSFTGVQPYAVANELVAFSSMDMEEDLFQGAPLLPRMPSGDAFDLLLQRWLTSSRQSPSVSLPSALPASLQAEALQIQQQPYQDNGQHQQQFGVPSYQQPPSYAQPSSSEAEFLQQLAAGNMTRNVQDQNPALVFPPITHTGQQPSPTYQYSDFPDGPSRTTNEHSPQASSMSGRTSGSEHSNLPAARAAAPGATAQSQPGPSRDAPSSNTSSQLNLAAGVLAMMPGVEGSIQAAKGAWTKQRRGPTSQESKEKERARNRRAQKRFREREKERQEQRQNAMATLEAELAAMAKEKKELQEKNAALERAMAMRSEQQKFDNQPAKFDGQYYVEAHIDDPSELLPLLTVSGNPRKVTQEEVQQMTFPQHAALYKEYVDALQAQLQLANTPEKSERMIQLVQELCALNLAVAMAKPHEFSAFQVSRLDGDKADPAVPPQSVWQRCLAEIKLGTEQKQALLLDRRRFLKRLSPLLKQRWELHRLLAATFPKEESAMGKREQTVKAMDAVEQLRENLRQEQVLLVQSMCATHQQLLAPHQTAANIVSAYPFYPDVTMLVDIIASETPGEPSTTELLGVMELPPST